MAPNAVLGWWTEDVLKKFATWIYSRVRCPIFEIAGRTILTDIFSVFSFIFFSGYLSVPSIRMFVLHCGIPTRWFFYTGNLKFEKICLKFNIGFGGPALALAVVSGWWPQPTKMSINDVANDLSFHRWRVVSRRYRSLRQFATIGHIVWERR